MRAKGLNKPRYEPGLELIVGCKLPERALPLLGISFIVWVSFAAEMRGVPPAPERNRRKT
jgi:hypothetical protein